MHIELAGIPGSGKTTVSAALVKKLNANGTTACTKQSALLKALKKKDQGRFRNFIKKFPAKLWQTCLLEEIMLHEFAALSSRHLAFIGFVSNILRQTEHDESLTESIWYTFARTFAETELIFRHTEPAPVILLDEAFCQRCFTLFGYGAKAVPDEMIRQYANLAPISDNICLIDTDPDICVNRFCKRYQFRPLPYGFKLDKEELKREFQTGADILSRFCKILASMGKTVFHISGEKDPEDTVNRLYRHISRAGLLS